MDSEILSSAAIISGMNLIILMLLFVGLVAWAWSKKRIKKFDEYAAIPLEESESPVSDTHEHMPSSNSNTHQ